MPKGAEKPCDYTGGSEPMFLCILIKNLSALIEKYPKILKSTRTSVCFMDASWLIWSMNSKETLSRDAAHIIDLYLIILTPVPDISIVKLMKLTYNLLEPRHI